MTAQPSAPGAIKVTTPTGSEFVEVITGGPAKAVMTTQQIANLASGTAGSGQLVNTPITTAGNGTWTGAAIASGLITRTGPVAAYTDTTDTALAIVAAIPNAFIGQSFILRVKNGVNFIMTVAAGAGVTLTSGTTPVIPPNSVAEYLVTLTSLTAVTMLHLSTTPLANPLPEIVTALNTVGAGVPTGAGIAGGVTTRGGSQANTAFTDTTDTAANIILAQANVHIGDSWEWTYQNNTNANATLAGGSGVTLTGVTLVPGGASARFLVTYTGAGAVSMVGISQTSPSSVSGTLTLNGVTPVTVTDSRVTANSSIIVTLKTIGGTVGVYPHIATITPGTGFTILGTASDTSVYNYLIIN